ncbi:CPBP family intramembrane glutamic endopeptidase [Chryseobacterium daeguense]|uniref:CPBP family intramembrane glutamic endopeptidase n=1 Tax=Chryseobacterium daeguense TaxID=412438 RepID=UPI0003F6EA43|nr:CPBP family intramembrane glutamic endopeptidase [Chryseobacterium daeguense]
MKVFNKDIVFALILILLLNSVFQNLISTFISSTNEALAFKVALKLMLSIVIILLIKHNNQEPVKVNFKGILLSSIVIVFSFFSIQNEKIEIITNFLFLLSCISVAVFEELLFRKFLFEKINNSNTKNYEFQVILITSVFFAAVHILNLLKVNYDLYSTINQIFFAFGIGVILQYIYYRTKQLIACITIHGIINYFGTYKSYLYDTTTDGISYSFSDFIVTLIFISIVNCVIVGVIYLLYQQSRKLI